MTKVLVVLAGLLVALATAVPSAEAITGAVTCATNLLSLAGSTCTQADKLFTFGTVTFGNFTPTLTNNSILYFTDNPHSTVVGDPGFEISGLTGFSVSSGAMDITINYTVQTVSGQPLIHDDFLRFAGSATGTGIADVSETACNSAGVCNDFSLNVHQNPNSTLFVDQNLSFGPVSWLDVTKDISVTAGSLGTASISEVDQSFSQLVPEPATLFLLGSGLAGAGIFARRRVKKAAV